MLPTFRRSVARTLRRFSRSSHASTAVEFAFIAPLFFALLFAIIETALVFFAGQILETAVQEASRKILTGQAQTGALSKSQFKDEVCSHITAIIDCSGGVYVDVRSYSSFNNVTIAEPVDASKNFVDNTQYTPGGSGDIVVVRVFFQWQLFVTGLGYNIANLSGNKRLLSATAAFRNEPY